MKRKTGIVWGVLLALSAALLLAAFSTGSPIFLAGADILGNEGRHGLHQCRWNQHNKRNNFLRNIKQI